jgi:hypothetical protein
MAFIFSGVSSVGTDVISVTYGHIHGHDIHQQHWQHTDEKAGTTLQAKCFVLHLESE